MKTFREYLKESLKPDLEKKLIAAAHEFHHAADPDLPRHGNYRYLAAKEHVADRLYDKFYKAHPEVIKHLDRIARKVVSQYESNDTTKSKAAEKRASRPSKPPKIKAPKLPKIKRWDDEKPFSRFKKGIGSY